VDGVILVVDLRSATTSAVRQALRQLETIKAPLLGLVINRDRDASTGAYYYYTPIPSQASKETGRVYQTGTQRLSEPNFVAAIELARSGKLGRVHTVRAHIAPWDDALMRHDWLPAEPEPPKDVVDWDRWLGPTPWRPYNARYVSGGWRGFFDFHGGGILEWGAHTVDLCQWAAGKDHTTPVAYEPQGSGVVATYADGVKLVMRDAGWMGLGTCSVRYEGDEGWIETGDSGNFALHPESLRTARTVFNVAGTDPATHVRNFLDCVKSRAACSCDIETGHRSTSATLIANVAHKTKSYLEWDRTAERFTNNADANRLLSYRYRAPYKLPDPARTDAGV
jgi:predicted dehydrogenase